MERSVLLSLVIITIIVIVITHDIIKQFFLRRRNKLHCSEYDITLTGMSMITIDRYYRFTDYTQNRFRRFGVFVIWKVGTNILYRPIKTKNVYPQY